MADNNKKRKTLMGTIEEGQILKEFSQTHFISVAPKPNIDRIQIQIVKQGTKGKDFVDFWLTTTQMYNLCTEILNGKFATRCVKDIDKQYPEAYKYVSGVNGSKILSIGGGKKGIRVNIKNTKDNKAVFGNMAGITLESLSMMAELFLIIYGFKPCSYFMKNVADAFWKYNSNSANNYNISDDDMPSTIDDAAEASNSASEPSDTNKADNDTLSDSKGVNKPNDSSNNSITNPEKSADAPEEQAGEKVSVKKITVFAINGSFKDYTNGKSFEAYECVEGNPGTRKLQVMAINGDTEITQQEFNDFKEFAQQNELTKTEIVYYVKNGHCYLKNFA